MLLFVCLVSAPPSSTSVSSPTTLAFSFLTQAHIAFRPCHSGLHKSTCRHHTHTHTQSQQNKVRMSRTYDLHFVYPCSNCSSSGHIRGSLRHVSSGCATSWSAMCSHGSTDSLLSWRCWIQRNRPPTIGLRNPPARLHGLLLTAAHTSSAPDRAGQRHLPDSANESTRFLTQHTAFRPHLRISKPGRKKASHSHASHAPPGLVCLPTGERQSR